MALLVSVSPRVTPRSTFNDTWNPRPRRTRKDAPKPLFIRCLRLVSADLFPTTSVSASARPAGLCITLPRPPATLFPQTKTTSDPRSICVATKV